jgi:hypothetical protein
MFSDPVMFFPGCVQRIDMDGGIGKIAQMMQELMPCVFGDFVTFLNRNIRRHGDIEFGMQPMTQPSHPHLRDVLHPGCVINRVFDVIDDLRVDTVEQAREYGLSGLPYDAEDGHSYEKADNRVGQWKTESDANGTE